MKKMSMTRKLSLLVGSSFLLMSGYVEAKTFRVISEADSGPGTLREIITNEASDGDKIRFRNNVHLITLTSGQIVIDKDLKISGKNVAISGNDSSRIFEVALDTSVCIKDLELREGRVFSTNSGGAILNRGNVELDKVTFTNNTANATGGAIDNRGQMEISKSSFLNNNGANGAGAISNIGPLKITKCSFNDNRGGNVGAIANSSDLEVDKSSFINNRAANGNGGAIVHDFGLLTITDCEFESNQAGDTAGGALYLTAPATIEKSTFTNNSADGRGGAISNSSDLFLDKCSITNNSAGPFGGGGIYNGSSGNLVLEKCSITNNSTSGPGGGIYQLGTLSQNKTTISSNSPDDIAP